MMLMNYCINKKWIYITLLFCNWSFLYAMQISEKPETFESKKIYPPFIRLIKDKAPIQQLEAAVSRGADVNEVYQDLSPLIEAVRNGDESLVRWLHTNGADINKSAFNVTPLIKSVENLDAN